MTKMLLSDDGTMDTVIACRDCGEEFRFNFSESAGENEGEEAYDAFVDECIETAESEHECDRHEYVGRSGKVEILLNFTDSDNTYDGKVRVDDHTYSISVSAPKAGFGPGVAYDSDEAFKRSAHAALSFAAADTEWGEGSDIFTPAAEMDDKGWVIARVK